MKYFHRFVKYKTFLILERGKQIAHYLLEIQAVRLNVEKPFQWASGWLSPIYCDNRVSLSYPVIRTFIRDSFVQTIRQSFSSAEAICGVATGGIPQGALVADQFHLPFLYARTSPKAHGLTNLIEGKIQAGEKVVVLEDLISTGESSFRVVEALRKTGAEIIGLCSIFSYEFQQAKDLFSKNNVSIQSLCTFSTLMEVAKEKKYISNAQLQIIEEWRKQPGSWKKALS